jgi:ribosome-associated protein
LTVRRFEIADLAAWIEVRFGPASGPGGQNVNKVSTRAMVIFDFRRCALLNDAERERIAQRYAARLTRDGCLRVMAQRARTQAANRAQAEGRLLELLAEGLYVPPQRRPTRPTRGARRRRIDAKKRRGTAKQQRRAPVSGDE